MSEVKVIFVQPFTVSETIAEQCGQRVVVVDVAFNAGSPQAPGTPEEQYQATTQAFIDALGDRLVAWVDHHPHVKWSAYKKDPRFTLVPREQAAACPPLLTPEVVAGFGEIDTIVAHGDFDGEFSAVKVLNGGYEAYPGMDADSIAADSRVGTLSLQGQRYEAALKANMTDDAVRQAIVVEATWNEGDAVETLQQATQVIEAAAHRYAEIQAETERLTGKFAVVGKVAWQDTTADENDEKLYDMTQLLLAGQKIAEVAMIRAKNPRGIQITVAAAPTWDFVEIFGLPGGMSNRITLPDQSVDRLIQQINEA